MRLTEFLIVILASLMFLIPTMKQKKGEIEIQAQEEEANHFQDKSYLVIYEAKGIEEESIADILWLKKAAAIALEHDRPYFSIKDQSIKKKFNKKQSRDLSIIEGRIELNSDPVKSEYDAYVIEDLILGE